MPAKVHVRSDDVAAALRDRFCLPEWAIFFEVRDATGFAGEGRSADAVAMNCYPSRGMEVHGIEIKVSRSDWMRELRNPDKSIAVQKYCDRWWIACPAGTMMTGELPPTWGHLEFEGGKLRQIREAPKLDCAPMSRTFVASILRSSSTLSSAGVRASIEAAVAKERQRGEAAAEQRLDVARRNATEAMEKVAQIKEATGIDLASYSWSADDIIKGITFAHAVRLHGWGAFSGMFHDLQRTVETIRAAAEKYGIELKDGNG